MINYIKITLNAMIVPIILFGNCHAFCKPKIAISIAPIASIAAMLMHDIAEIDIIAANTSCPHDYHLTISNLRTINNADIFIYIDDKFDNFALKVVKHSASHIIKLSQFHNLYLIANYGEYNWHLWLDLQNVQLILQHLAQIFSDIFPDLKKEIYTNLNKSSTVIANLHKIKNESLAGLKDAILLTDSAEYFFHNQCKIYKFYHKDYASLKDIQNINYLLQDSTNKCLVLNSNYASYKKFNAKIVQIESENWALSKVDNMTFYNQYLKMIEQIKHCLEPVHDL